MPCLPCGRNFHSECENNNCANCHPDYVKLSNSLTGRSEDRNSGLMGQPTKNPEDVRDVLSTGRKRAAQLWPLFRDKPCDWQGKKNCGGGVKPIVGCADGMQLNRHHGPVKLPLRNEPGNVHRICTKCHARWHADNDPNYDEKRNESLPHNPEPATELEIAVNESEWKLRTL